MQLVAHVNRLVKGVRCCCCCCILWLRLPLIDAAAAGGYCLSQGSKDGIGRRLKISINFLSCFIPRWFHQFGCPAEGC